LIWGESREAWVVCFIAMIMAVFAWGTVFYGNGIYLPFLHQDRGWSVSAISLAMLFFALAGVTATLIVGRLVDRVSPAMALVWGALTIGPGLILIGRVDHLWQLYFVYCLFGMGYPALGTAGVSAILSLWFRQRYGLGLALSLSGASIGGSIFPVTMAWLSEKIGFATTTLGFGVFLIVVIIPLAAGLLILDRRRVGGGLTAAADVTGDGLALVARRPLFWVVTGACGLTLGAQVGFLQHQINFISIDVTVVVASLVVTVTVFAGALGRFLFGWLSARSHPRLLLAGLQHAPGNGVDRDGCRAGVSGPRRCLDRHWFCCRRDCDVAANPGEIPVWQPGFWASLRPYQCCIIYRYGQWTVDHRSDPRCCRQLSYGFFNACRLPVIGGDNLGICAPGALIRIRFRRRH
jgi:MFS family permease